MLPVTISIGFQDVEEEIGPWSSSFTFFSPQEPLSKCTVVMYVLDERDGESILTANKSIVRYRNTLNPLQQITIHLLTCCHTVLKNCGSQYGVCSLNFHKLHYSFIVSYCHMTIYSQHLVAWNSKFLLMFTELQVGWMVLRALSGLTYGTWGPACWSLLGFLTCLGGGVAGWVHSQMVTTGLPSTWSALLQQASSGYWRGSKRVSRSMQWVPFEVQVQNWHIVTSAFYQQKQGVRLAWIQRVRIDFSSFFLLLPFSSSFPPPFFFFCC